MSKFYIPRRTFLKGAGASIFLPMLDIMVPSKAMGAVPAGTPRFAMFFMSLGMYGEGIDESKSGTARYFQAAPYKGLGSGTMGAWNPKAVGALPSSLPVHLSPFNSLKDKITIVSGLSSSPGDWDEPITNHSAATTNWAVAAWQTIQEARPVNRSPPDSLDQFIANACGITPGSTLVFNPNPYDFSEGDGGHVGFISSNSKLGGNNLVPQIKDPLKAFNILFGSCKPTTGDQAGPDDQKSVLDYVMNQIKSLQAKVGAEDKNRLEAYFQNVRELERSIQSAPSSSCPTTPTYDPALNGGELDWVGRMRMIVDVTALAMASDSMPIASIMTDTEADANPSHRRRVEYASDYRDKAGNKVNYHDAIDTHHDVTHKSDPNFQSGNADEKVRAIEEWFAYTRVNVLLLRRLADKLNNLPVEPNGNTPLDNSLILGGAAFSSAVSHNTHNLPIILIGGKKAKLRQGQHINFPIRTHLGRLYLTMIRAMGVDAAKYHMHTQILPGVFNP